MKNIYKLRVVLLFFLTVVYTQAQDNPSNTTDSIPPVLLPYNFNANQNGGLFLNSSSTEVIYDAETGKYIFLEKIGDFYVKRPIYMTAKEYEEYRLQR
ncbi:MAG TPA: hypothetical protein EYG80_07530, partial [Flavobacteriaceae bacterium]|nr:hypothetical protein [Flavobacteriaceae bacterium]